MSDSLKKIVSEWQEFFQFPELIHRECQHPNLLNLSEILAIVGPRRAGKTFYFFQLMQNLFASGNVSKSAVLFVDFEDYRLSGSDSSVMDALIATHYQITGTAPVYLFLDEVQSLPNWSRVLRTLHNTQRYKIVVSGSNSELLSREIATELRGRCIEMFLYPFSFHEYLAYKQVHFTQLTFHTPLKGLIIKAFDEFLKTGGFPEVVKKTNILESNQILQSYFRTTYYKDIIERYDIKAKETLEGMMLHAIHHVSELFSISAYEKVVRQTGHSISKRTLSNYLGYLEEAFFVITTEKFSFSQRKRTMNPKKCYLVDVGFKSLATDFSENRGKILENIVAIELHRRGKTFFYYKDSSECDFIIVENGTPTVAIQVCWELNENNRKREMKGLTDAASSLNISSQVILTYDQNEQTEHYRVRSCWEWLLSAEQ